MTFLRTYAIGDVHGMIEPLERLLAWIDKDASQHPAPTQVVFIGDLVDRGPASQAVVQLVRHGLTERFDKISVLRGNHDHAFAAAIAGPHIPHLHRWIETQMDEALASYGLTSSDLLQGDEGQLVAIQDDARWMKTLPLLLDDGFNIFCHAGLDRRRKLDAQEDHLLWGDKDFGAKAWHTTGAIRGSLEPRRIIHGHYPILRGPEVEDWRINVDTGCVFGGALTCLILEEPKARPRFAQATDAGRSIRTFTHRP